MAQDIFQVSNFRKTYYYLKKNGWKNAYYAVMERLSERRGPEYHYTGPTEEELAVQRGSAEKYPYRFSILVPTYETEEKYLREMIESVLNQTYGNLELILADASQSEKVRKTAEAYNDERIRYIHLEENKGIAENTNAALAAAGGDYVGLLDHDDVLTPNALYEMAKAIAEGGEAEKQPWLLYSDEDKGNGELTEFYEPHRKPGLNMDLLFSNNYICHFLVMKRELIQSLGFRKEYDGAQDYDLVLRAVGRLIYEERRGRGAVAHVPKVLYHWRCHTGSTAENPESKRYAYEAGKRALEDFMACRGWEGTVSHTLHLGFYRIDYEHGIFAQRKEVGVIGGKLMDRRGRVAGGIYNGKGKCPYAGLPRKFSGYMHRAGLIQEAYAVDLRCMRVKKELWGIFEDVFGTPYRERLVDGYRRYPYGEGGPYPWEATADGQEMEPEADTGLRQRCIEFGRRVRRAGYMVVWMPDWETVQK